MIKTWAVTDTGLVRKENQDTYRIARNGDICVVCDGMGGCRRRPACQYAGVGDLRGGDGEGPETGYDPGAAPEASAYAVAMANRPWRSGQRRRRRLPIWVPLWLPLWPMRTAR